MKCEICKKEIGRNSIKYCSTICAGIGSQTKEKTLEQKYNEVFSQLREEVIKGAEKDLLISQLHGANHKLTAELLESKERLLVAEELAQGVLTKSVDRYLNWG